MFYEFLVKRLEHKNDPSGIFSAQFFAVQYCAIACNKAVNLQIYKDILFTTFVIRQTVWGDSSSDTTQEWLKA